MKDKNGKPIMEEVKYLIFCMSMEYMITEEIMCYLLTHCINDKQRNNFYTGLITYTDSCGG